MARYIEDVIPYKTTDSPTTTRSDEEMTICLKIPRKVLKKNRKGSSTQKTKSGTGSTASESDPRKLNVEDLPSILQDLSEPPYVTVTSLDRQGRYHTFGGYGFDMRQYSPVASFSGIGLKPAPPPDDILSSPGPNFSVIPNKSLPSHGGALRGSIEDESFYDQAPGVQHEGFDDDLPAFVEDAAIIDEGTTTLLESLDHYLKSLKKHVDYIDHQREERPKKRRNLGPSRHTYPYRSRPYDLGEMPRTQAVHKRQGKGASRTTLKPYQVGSSGGNVESFLQDARIVDEGEGSLDANRMAAHRSRQVRKDDRLSAPTKKILEDYLNARSAEQYSDNSKTVGRLSAIIIVGVIAVIAAFILRNIAIISHKVETFFKKK